MKNPRINWGLDSNTMELVGQVGKTEMFRVKKDDVNAEMPTYMKLMCMDGNVMRFVSPEEAMDFAETIIDEASIIPSGMALGTMQKSSETSR